MRLQSHEPAARSRNMGERAFWRVASRRKRLGRGAERAREAGRRAGRRGQRQSRSHDVFDRHRLAWPSTNPQETHIPVGCPQAGAFQATRVSTWTIGNDAEQKLPDSVPAFVRTPEATAEIAVMGGKLDRSKGDGETHDKERDPGHYVDLADDGSVMGVLPIDKLPGTREAYDAQRHAGGHTQYKAGAESLDITSLWNISPSALRSRVDHARVRSIRLIPPFFGRRKKSFTPKIRSSKRLLLAHHVVLATIFYSIAQLPSVARSA